MRTDSTDVQARESGGPRDAGNWATKVDRLAAPDEKSKVGYNITGKKVTGPQQGFGRLWQRTYSTDVGDGGRGDGPYRRLEGELRRLLASWEHVPQPPDGDRTGCCHSDRGGHRQSRGPKLATGILVIYADDESFTFMTPEGHMFAGMITFRRERRTATRASRSRS